ncbi:MBL fold metallo-hydrolase [Paenibacillus sp. FSL R7-0337]|uniref:MBL fold metallo-hydrolase n=1 Tax=Paenibacillus sp. FSL R7-0337 TaxID=1926588 RepID=UPI00096EB48D|nr:MBL fold metallo-hydrolase [Paenibacillus sp. FSL R7-0337]OMF85010.1 MBL fold metallo-hydrolase [Paenibacillus sp. FSL R7-0337]
MLNRIESFEGSRHFRLQYIADSTVAAVAVPGTGSLANAAIIDLGGLTLVVDTFATLEAAQDLKAAAEYLTGNPVSYVINTHWHSDHTTGNQVFVPDAQLIATSGTRETMNTFARDRVAKYQNNREKMLEAIREAELQGEQETDSKLKQEMAWENATDREFVNMLPQLVHTVPSVTFDRHMTIHGSNRSAQLITYGGGHTQSDAIVYLPEDKIVIIGDLVLSNHHPVLANANPQEWLYILEQVESLDVETIVPGHGEVCSLQQLHAVKGYISRMIAIVTEAVQNQQSIEEIEIPEKYRAWYFTTYFRTNLNKLYELITASGE